MSHKALLELKGSVIGVCIKPSSSVSVGTWTSHAKGRGFSGRPLQDEQLFHKHTGCLVEDVVTLNSTPVLVGRALSVMGSLAETTSAMLASGPKMRMLRECQALHGSLLATAREKVPPQAMLCHEAGWVAISLSEVSRLEVFPSAYLTSPTELRKLFGELDAARRDAEKKYPEAPDRFYSSLRMASQAALSALTLSGTFGAGLYFISQEKQNTKPVPNSIPGGVRYGFSGAKKAESQVSQPHSQDASVNEPKGSVASKPEPAGKSDASSPPVAAVVASASKTKSDPQSSPLPIQAGQDPKREQSLQSNSAPLSKGDASSQQGMPPTPQVAALPAEAKKEPKPELNSQAKEPVSPKVETTAQNGKPSAPPAPRVATLPPESKPAPKTEPKPQPKDPVAQKSETPSPKAMPSVPPAPQVVTLPPESKPAPKAEPKPQPKDSVAQKVETPSPKVMPSAPPAPNVATLKPETKPAPKPELNSIPKDSVPQKVEAPPQKATPPPPQVATLPTEGKPEAKPLAKDSAALKVETLSQKLTPPKQPKADTEKSRAVESLSQADQSKLASGLRNLSDALRAFGDTPPQINVGTAQRSRESVEAFRQALLQLRPESVEQKILVSSAERLLTEGMSSQSLYKFEVIVRGVNRQSREVNPIEPGVSGRHLDTKEIRSQFIEQIQLVGKILQRKGFGAPVCKAGSSKEMYETVEAYMAAIERLGPKASLFDGEQLTSCLDILHKRGVTSASLAAYKRSLNLRSSLPRFGILRQLLDAVRGNPLPKLQGVVIPEVEIRERAKADAELRRQAAHSQQVALNALKVIPPHVLAPGSLKRFDPSKPAEIESELQKVFFALYHPQVSRSRNPHASAVAREMDMWRAVIAHQRQPATSSGR